MSTPCPDLVLTQRKCVHVPLPAAGGLETPLPNPHFEAAFNLRLLPSRALFSEETVSYYRHQHTLTTASFQRVLCYTDHSLIHLNTDKGVSHGSSQGTDSSFSFDILIN